MNIILIAAISKNGAIGYGGKIPWNIPEEQQFFKKITMGNALLFGRKTYESIGRALPGRQNIIITRQKDYTAPGCIVKGSLDEAISFCEQANQDLFVSGGAQIYRIALPLAHKIYLTTIHREVEGDTFFPDFNPEEFKTVHSEEFSNEESYTFTIHERIAPCHDANVVATAGYTARD